MIVRLIVRGAIPKMVHGMRARAGEPFQVSYLFLPVRWGISAGADESPDADHASVPRVTANY